MPNKQYYLSTSVWMSDEEIKYSNIYIYMGFPGSSNGKESACSAEDLGLIPAEGRSPGEGNGNPLLCSCLRNPMDRSEVK